MSSSKIKVAINGFGRIGRSIAKIIAKRDDLELVAINDVAPIEILENLLKYDSVQGSFKDVEILSDNYLKILNSKVKVLSEEVHNNLNFGEFGAEVVIEASGKFLTFEYGLNHINKGVKKVIFSAPAKDDTKTFVLGVNEHNYNGENIISNASCTTNCIAPIAKIINENFEIQKGFLTTTHSYTNDQNLLDSNHSRDIRRCRASAINIIPTSTGATKAMGKVLPELRDKFDGVSLRVPVANVSIADLNILIKKNTSKEELNELFIKKAQNELKGIIEIDSDFRVSSDFILNPHSAIIAKDLTQVIGGNLIKIMAWYDNEWGYSNRLVEMIKYISIDTIAHKNNKRC